MKFCYVDETGHGDEPVFVMASIIADASRMHKTKEHWKSILGALSRILEKPVREFHTRHFYRGKGIWHELNGNQRSKVMDIIIEWLQDRHHKVTFTAIDKNKANEYSGTNRKEYLISGKRPNYWQLAALHLVLCIQKEHQTYPGIKGHTVIIFDHEIREENKLTEIVLDPPEWTDSYYGYNRRSRKRDKPPPLNNIVDVPYFADSKQIGMLHIADLFAYLLRHYAELQLEYAEEQYSGEGQKVKSWVKKISKFMLHDSNRWPAIGACECAEFFKSMAPTPLLRIQAESTR